MGILSGGMQRKCRKKKKEAGVGKGPGRFRKGQWRKIVVLVSSLVWQEGRAGSFLLFLIHTDFIVDNVECIHPTQEEECGTRCGKSYWTSPCGATIYKYRFGESKAKICLHYTRTSCGAAKKLEE
jgi:hypothetical protein